MSELFSNILIFTIVALAFTFSRRVRMRFLFVLCAAISIFVLVVVRPVNVPIDSELKLAEGTIVESYHVSDNKPDVIFRLSDHPWRYRYNKWYPNFKEIEPRLYIENSMRISYTIRSADSTWANVWRMEYAGKILASREQIADAEQHNYRLGNYAAIGFGLVPLVLSIINIYSRWKNRRLTRRARPIRRRASKLTVGAEVR